MITSALCSIYPCVSPSRPLHASFHTSPPSHHSIYSNRNIRSTQVQHRVLWHQLRPGSRRGLPLLSQPARMGGGRPGQTRFVVQYSFPRLGRASCKRLRVKRQGRRHLPCGSFGGHADGWSLCACLVLLPTFSKPHQEYLPTVGSALSVAGGDVCPCGCQGGGWRRERKSKRCLKNILERLCTEDGNKK